MVRTTRNSSGESGDRDIEEVWNWYCFDCKWKGVAQELAQDESLEEWWCCPRCHSPNIEDVGWHQGNEKYKGAKWT